MDTVSDALRELLNRQGITREGLAGPVARGMKAGERSGAARPELRQPREELLPMGIQEKDRDGETPAKFGMLRLVSSRCEPTRSKAGKPLPGVGSHLVLVWSDGHLVTRRPSTARQ
jgi:hypothetical protein